MKRFLVLLVVALCSAMLFSSCKKDENNLNYDEVLQGKWLVKSISPALDDTYIPEGSTLEFKSDYTFTLGSQWNTYFKASTWLTSMERGTNDVYLLMLGMDNKDESVVIMEGRVNLSGKDTIYIDCADAFMPSVTYRYMLVRQ